MKKYLYSDAVQQALQVDFITSSEELTLYANALYAAVLWGREMDERNETIRQTDGAIR